MDCEPIILAHEAPFRIGEAEFRPATREVVVDGTSALLEPRVMQFLVALHRAQGGVVTKDELTRQCWDGRVVGEDAINRVVSRLRSASESLGNPFRVETITRVGYRLAPGTNGEPVHSGAAERAGLSVDRRQLLVGGTAAAVVAAAALGWSALRERRRLAARSQAARRKCEEVPTRSMSPTSMPMRSRSCGGRPR